MTKLRVGDILIEDDRIQIRGQEVTQTPAIPTNNCAPVTPSVAFLLWLRAAPIPARVLGWLGTALVVAGLVVALATAAWQDPVSAILRGGFLIPIGAGLLAAAFLKQKMRVGTFDVNLLALGSTGEQTVERVRSVLKLDGKHQTVEWIEQQTGLDETKVIRALAILRDRQELLEELDPDSGDFYYHLARRDPEDLNSRLASIDQRRHT